MGGTAGAEVVPRAEGALSVGQVQDRHRFEGEGNGGRKKTEQLCADPMIWSTLGLVLCTLEFGSSSGVHVQLCSSSDYGRTAPTWRNTCIVLYWQDPWGPVQDHRVPRRRGGQGLREPSGQFVLSAATGIDLQTKFGQSDRISPIILLGLSVGLHYSYIGTAYMYAYDREHPVGGPGFKENGKSYELGPSLISNHRFAHLLWKLLLGSESIHRPDAQSDELPGADQCSDHPSAELCIGRRTKFVGENHQIQVCGDSENDL